MTTFEQSRSNYKRTKQRQPKQQTEEVSIGRCCWGDKKSIWPAKRTAS